MKLGDSMAPIEACNVWNDVCPRKTRPPKIGDIPRHVAVDEEGSSAARSVARFDETRKIPSRPMLERSTSRCDSERAKAASGALPRLESFLKSRENTRKLERVSRVPDEKDFGREASFELSGDSEKSITLDETSNGPGPMHDEIREISSGERQLESMKKKSCARVLESAGETRGRLCEEAVVDGVFEVRKDSALYLDERNLEGLIPRDRSPVRRKVEEVGNSGVSGARTRRESSGYFSNLGTFDEDRWSVGPMDHSAPQDGPSTTARESLLRERRGSSTKNRLPASDQQHRVAALAAADGPRASGQRVNRIASLGCAENDERSVCLSEKDSRPTDAMTGSVRTEVPKTARESRLRERRGSSTKNRLPASDQQPRVAAVAAADGPRASGQRVNRIASLECAENDERSVCLSEKDSRPTDAMTGSVRTEVPKTARESRLRERRGSSTKNRLPASDQQHRVAALAAADGPRASGQRVNRIASDIDERASLEIKKCSHVDGRSNETEESVEIDVELASKLSLRPSSLRNQILSSRADNSTIEGRDDEVRSSSDKGESDETGKAMFDPSTQRSSSPRAAANRQRRRIVVHQYSSPNITNTELERIVEKPYGETPLRTRTAETQPDDRSSHDEKLVKVESDESTEDCDDDEHVVVARHDGASDSCGDVECDARKLLPKSIKVYQLLSTQSEDRGDGDARLFDRRISLQIPRNNDEEATRVNECPSLPRNFAPPRSEYVEEKKLVHADSVPILKISSLVSTTVEAGERIPGSEISTGPGIAGIRPIYPYCPCSPYASPQGSPRTSRRRPLRESRRVSIDSRQGALQLNQYKLLNNIGQGSYGIVKLAYNEDDETHYAMKILSKKKLMKKAGIFGRIAPGRKGISNPLAKVYREIALLKKLDHPNVVKLVEVLDDPDEDNLYLVFELVQKGEVMQLPTDKPLDEETARRHFRDVVMGVEYLHYQRIVHRDIKPSNLLVDSDGRVKVADLGVSAELRAAGELLSGSAGTPAFAAPETTTPGAQYSGTLCDVWSMGVTLYSLVTGKVPWDGAGSIIGVQAAVRSEPLRFPEKSQLSDSLQDLVSRMLAKDPSRRMSLSEIKEHCWLTNNGEEPLPNDADNCRLPVTVTDEEVARVVTRVPKLDTLILIKTMLKQHSFQNPFLPRRIVRTGESVTSGASLKQQASTDITDSSTKLLPTGETLKSKTEQFHKAGRSNSAPDSYEWQTNGRQVSSDSLLPPVTESSSQEAEVENR